VILKEEKRLAIRRKVSYAVSRTNGERVATRPFSGKLPAVLCLHQTIAKGKDGGWSGGRLKSPLRTELTMRGYVTLTPDHVAAGERKPTGLETYTAVTINAIGWSAVGKSMGHSRAVDYLLRLSFVDRKRIGGIGHSLARTRRRSPAFDSRMWWSLELR
jgi:hypothetical protein